MPPDEYSDLDESRVDSGAITAMRRLFRERKFPVFIFGEVGRGKSFLAALVCAKWPGSCLMLRYSDFINDSIRAAKDGGFGRYTSNAIWCEFTEASWWKHLSDVGLVIVDEIGVGISSGAAAEWRNELLWKLLEVRKNKPLILTANIQPTELVQRFDSRIQSRIIAGSLFELGGKDQRLEGLQNRIVRVG